MQFTQNPNIIITFIYCCTIPLRMAWDKEVIHLSY